MPTSLLPIKRSHQEWARPRQPEESLFQFAIRRALLDPNLELMSLVGINPLGELRKLGWLVDEAVPTSRLGPKAGQTVSSTINNASLEAGRGGPSMESLGRLAWMKATGRRPMLRGPGGVMRPYLGDPSDAVVNPGWEIGYLGPKGWEKIR